MTLKTRRGVTETRWISQDVAVSGTVKVERDGKLFSETLDWGFEPAK